MYTKSKVLARLVNFTAKLARLTNSVYTVVDTRVYTIKKERLCMDTNSSEMPLKQFRFKLSARSPRDKKLAEWMKEDLDQGEVNLSGVTKDLLYQWYQLRNAVGYIPDPGAMVSSGVVYQLPARTGDEMSEEETYASPDDPLTQRLMGVHQGFDNL